MRVLCVSDTYPWPSTDGYRQRLSQLLRGLSEAGAVDLFAVESDRSDVGAGAVPAPVVDRAFVSPRPGFGRDPAKVARWVASPLPRAVLWHEWRRARGELAGWAAEPYDLVWYSHLDSYLALRDVPESAPGKPAVVDLDNLEDLKLRASRQVRGAGRRRRLSPGHAVGLGFDLVDEWRWSRRQREAARSAAQVVVCSELDRERLAAERVTVIPNGYEREGPPVGDGPPAGTGPVFTMVGLMTYPPNLDAARHFAANVLPAVRRERPGAEFRVVGRGSVDGELASLPGVVVRGAVPDIRDELAQTTVAVVPIRFGGGTRIKVLEAFAHRVPVVATRTGAEGIDAADGGHLLVVDDGDGDGFARACLRLVEDHAFRKGMVDSAEARFLERYRWEVIRPKVTELARAVTQSPPVPGESVARGRARRR